MDIDKIDAAILSALTENARVSQVELAARVGLSSTAVARRQRALEEQGLITATGKTIVVYNARPKPKLEAVGL